VAIFRFQHADAGAVGFEPAGLAQVGEFAGDDFARGAERERDLLMRGYDISAGVGAAQEFAFESLLDGGEAAFLSEESTVAQPAHTSSDWIHFVQNDKLTRRAFIRSGRVPARAG